MGSVLIIKNNYEIEQALQDKLKEKYQLHIVEDAWSGLDTLDEHHIDVFIMMSAEETSDEILNFLRQAREDHSEWTPTIFISTERTEKLQLERDKSVASFFIPYPIIDNELLERLETCVRVAVLFDDQTIIIEKNGDDYKYKVKHVSRIERIKGRRIKVYYHNPVTQMEETEDFYYDHPLEDFITFHRVENRIRQAHQSWLVNTSHVKSVSSADYELILYDGKAVPTSRKFIGNFKRKRINKAKGGNKQ
ncbi:MAG: LytTR family transcriptional regulator DNA-binding domain-containing protein [Turicibacter sp.]|nr:LytTR family transcriptional regulator DNA-binding domain-containing protein [Turicibacter sp.]